LIEEIALVIFVHKMKPKTAKKKKKKKKKKNGGKKEKKMAKKGKEKGEKQFRYLL